MYEDINWKGKYMDFCTYQGKVKNYNLMAQWGKNNWEDEISSWKCGSHVMMKLCYTDECDDANVDETEKGGPMSFNRIIGTNDAVRSLVLTPTQAYPDCITNKKMCHPLTVFMQPNCKGRSTTVHYSEGSNSSRDMYPDYDTIGWPKGSIASILLPKETSMEWYYGEDFMNSEEVDYTYVMRNFGAYVCRESSELPYSTHDEQTYENYFMEQKSYTDYKTRSFQYRQQRQPGAEDEYKPPEPVPSPEDEELEAMGEGSEREGR